MNIDVHMNNVVTSMDKQVGVVVLSTTISRIGGLLCAEPVDANMGLDYSQHIFSNSPTKKTAAHKLVKAQINNNNLHLPLRSRQKNHQNIVLKTQNQML
jgi:hypothetical protein